MKLRSGTPEQEMKWDARRSDACQRLMQKICRKTSGWRVILTPFYWRSYAKLTKEMLDCDNSWHATFMYQQEQDRLRRVVRIVCGELMYSRKVYEDSGH